MKINRLETHDRLQHFKKDQDQNIFLGAETCMKRNPDSLFLQSRSPYIYIFAHPRTADDGLTKVMYWQPRLLKPPAQTNSYLFRAQSNSDIMEICWILPPREMWDQYTLGNITEHKDVLWSIDMFMNHRDQLNSPHPDDLDEKVASKIWLELVGNIRSEKLMAKVLEVTSG